MKIFLVGGAIRDKVLGLSPKEKDRLKQVFPEFAHSSIGDIVNRFRKRAEERYPEARRAREQAPRRGAQAPRSHGKEFPTAAFPTAAHPSAFHDDLTPTIQTTRPVFPHCTRRLGGGGVY